MSWLLHRMDEKASGFPEEVILYRVYHSLPGSHGRREARIATFGGLSMPYDAVAACCEECGHFLALTQEFTWSRPPGIHRIETMKLVAPLNGCECGGERAGTPHSDWCPRYVP